jgi:hypothetical protein
MLAVTNFGADLGDWQIESPIRNIIFRRSGAPHGVITEGLRRMP